MVIVSAIKHFPRADPRGFRLAARLAPKAARFLLYKEVSRARFASTGPWAAEWHIREVSPRVMRK